MNRKPKRRRSPRSVWDSWADDDEEPGTSDEHQRRLREQVAGGYGDNGVYADSNGCSRTRPLYDVEDS